jgi:hypothetical protein
MRVGTGIAIAGIVCAIAAVAIWTPEVLEVIGIGILLVLFV